MNNKTKGADREKTVLRFLEHYGYTPDRDYPQRLAFRPKLQSKDFRFFVAIGPRKLRLDVWEYTTGETLLSLEGQRIWLLLKTAEMAIAQWELVELEEEMDDEMEEKE